MELFIETPRRAKARGGQDNWILGASDRAGGSIGRVAGAQNGMSDFDLDEATGFERAGETGSMTFKDLRRAQRRDDYRRALAGKCAGEQVPSASQEAYQAEIAFDKKRRLRRKRNQVLRMLVAVLLIPVAVVAVFFISYALTLVLNGASPDEVASYMVNMLARIEGVLHDAGFSL